MSNSKRGLGRGIDALLPENISNRVEEVAIAHIAPNPQQPRRHFDTEELQELADSIRTNGIIQPLIVERSKQQEDQYTLIAGERRLRAAKMVPLSTVPAICRNYGESQRLRVALVENLQRSDLNAIEEAQAYQVILEESDLTQEALAQEVGKSRAAVTNTLRLLQLPTKIQNWIIQRQISPGHARALLSLSDAKRQQALGNKIISAGLSVRESERLVEAARQLRDHSAQETSANSPPSPQASLPNYELQAIEDRLRQRLRCKVHIQGGDRGRVVIHYYSLDDLNRLYQLICGSSNTLSD